MATRINNSTLYNSDNQNLRDEDLTGEIGSITSPEEVTSSELRNAGEATNSNQYVSTCQLSPLPECLSNERDHGNIHEESTGHLTVSAESSTLKSEATNTKHENSNDHLSLLTERLIYDRQPYNIDPEHRNYQLSSSTESFNSERQDRHINQEIRNNHISSLVETPTHEREDENFTQDESNNQIFSLTERSTNQREADNINVEDNHSQFSSSVIPTFDIETNNIMQEESNSHISTSMESLHCECQDNNANQDERNIPISSSIESLCNEREDNNINQVERNLPINTLPENSAHGSDIGQHSYLSTRARTCQCRLSGLAQGLAAPPCYNCSSTDLPPPYRKKEKSKLMRKLSSILATNENDLQPNLRQPSIFTINGNTTDLGYRLDDMNEDIQTNIHSAFSSTRFPYTNHRMEQWDLPNNQSRLDSDVNARNVAISTSFCLFNNMRSRLLFSMVLSIMLTASLFGVKQAPFALLFSTIIFTIAVFLPLIRLIEHIFVMRKNCQLYQQSMAENQQAFSNQGLNPSAFDEQLLSESEQSFSGVCLNNPPFSLQTVSEDENTYTTAQGSNHHGGILQTESEDEQNNSAHDLDNPALHLQTEPEDEHIIYAHGLDNPDVNLQIVPGDGEASTSLGLDNPAFDESELSTNDREQSTKGSIVGLDNRQSYDDISVRSTNHTSDRDRNTCHTATPTKIK